MFLIVLAVPSLFMLTHNAAAGLRLLLGGGARAEEAQKDKAEPRAANADVSPQGPLRLAAE